MYKEETMSKKTRIKNAKLSNSDSIQQRIDELKRKGRAMMPPAVQTHTDRKRCSKLRRRQKIEW